jgi:tetratricopeptide (TPR) repeat protein
MTIDFDGFDPGQKDSLESFALFQLRKQAGRAAGDEGDEGTQQRHDLVIDVAKELAASFFNAAGVSLLVGAALRLGAELQRKAPTFRTAPGPRATPDEALASILHGLTGDGDLVVQLVHNKVPQALGSWFLHQPRALPGLMVALSAEAPVAIGERIAGEAVACSFALRAYRPAELRRAVDDRLGAHELPDEFFQALHRQTDGIPRNVALAMFRLVGDDALAGGGDTPWRLPEGGMAAEPVLRHLSSNFHRILNQLRDSADPAERRLADFVERAALCGDAIPARLVASSLSLGAAHVDDLLDRVDALAGPDGKPLFVSEDYRHPSLRNQELQTELVYRFASAADRLLVLRQMFAGDRVQYAASLLATAKEALPLRTRGVAALLYELSRHLARDAPEREYYERCLKWWVGPEEARFLAEQLTEEVVEGRVDPDSLLRFAWAQDDWPPYRKLALVEAYSARPDGIPFDLVRPLHLYRASNLRLMGRLDEGLQEAEAGLELSEELRDKTSLQLSFIAAQCCLYTSRWEEMLSHVARAATLQRELGDADSPAGAHYTALSALAHLRTGRDAEARELVDEALVLAEPFMDGYTPGMAACWSALGVCLSQMGRPAEARRCFEEGLRVEVIEAEGDYADTMNLAIAHYNVGVAQRRDGEGHSAHDHLKRALQLVTEINGPDDPLVAQILLGLLPLSSHLGREAEVAEYSDWLTDLQESEIPEVQEQVAGAPLFIALTRLFTAERPESAAVQPGVGSPPAGILPLADVLADGWLQPEAAPQ